jgi:uncharacterized protein
MKSKILLAILMSISLLTGCATHSKFQLNLSAQEYLQLSATAQEPKKTQYLLNAVEKYLEVHQTKTATHILEAIDTSAITPQQQSYWQLLSGRNYLLKGNASAAVDSLSKLQNDQNLNPLQQQTLYRSLAQAYATLGDVTNSLIERDNLLRISEKDDKRSIIEGSWVYMQSLDISQLESIQNSSNALVSGWYNLIMISRHTGYSDAQLLNALQQWRSQFPNHPANQLLADNLSTNQLVYQKPQKISLLLPLSGQYGAAGNAIRNGFYAAYYNEKKSNTANLPTILTNNTVTTPVNQLYSTAVENGSDFIVGPLTKGNLQQLIDNNSINVPTLALNSLSDANSPLLIQFALSPIDEAQQVASFAWSQHHQRALIIATDSARGKDTLNEITKDWQNLGGNVVATWMVNSGPNLSSTLSKILLVDNSRTRHWRIQAVTGEKLRYHQRRRQDVDVILMATTPVIARQIQPLMKYYLAQDIPIYATSQLYTGSANPAADNDLNGIFFCDSPWILNPTAGNDARLAEIEQQISGVWPNNFKTYRRFYDMGIDAFDLSSRLNRLLLLPRIGWAAASGNLFLNPDKHVFRQLVWARFEKGRPRLLNN